MQDMNSYIYSATNHEQKCPANYSFHATCVFIVVMDTWWNCAYVAQATCILV